MGPGPYGTRKLEALLEAAQLHRIPVFLGLDGENWWRQSNLSNWYDPEGPGYDPANRENVEWTAPDGMANDASVLRISWRNWGRWPGFTEKPTRKHSKTDPDTLFRPAPAIPCLQVGRSG